MADTNQTVEQVIALQLAKQVSFGTGVTTATYDWAGKGSLKQENSIVRPKYMTGQPGLRTPGHAFPADTGTLFNVNDTQLSSTLAIWVLNQAVKTILGAAQSFPFTAPTTNSPNSITPFSWKLATLTDVWDVADCFFTEFNIHGMADSANGQMLFNGKLAGRKATNGGSLTTLSPIGKLFPRHTPGIFNFNNAQIKIAALGSVPSGGTDQSGGIKGFSLTWVTGYVPQRTADGRAALDYATIAGGGLAYDGHGEIEYVLGSLANTLISNAVAGTGFNIQLLFTAGNSDTLTIVLPIILTGAPEIGNSQIQNMTTVKFAYEVGPSDEAATPVHPSFTISTGASVTVT